eukprot:scaffold25789_cov101-Isochrysis_galbana.AAC.3
MPIGLHAGACGAICAAAIPPAYMGGDCIDGAGCMLMVPNEDCPKPLETDICGMPYCCGGMACCCGMLYCACYGAAEFTFGHCALTAGHCGRAGGTYCPEYDGPGEGGSRTSGGYSSLRCRFPETGGAASAACSLFTFFAASSKSATL